MLTLRDFLAARVAISKSLLPKEQALASLYDHGVSGSQNSWLKVQVASSRLDNQAAQMIYNEVERFEFLRAEKFYAAAAEQNGVAGIQAIAEQQRQENYRRRLGEMLAERNLIDLEAHKSILSSAKELFTKDTSQQLRSFRDTLLNSRANAAEGSPAPNTQTFSGELIPTEQRPNTSSWSRHGDLTMSQRDGLSAAAMGFGEGLDDDEELNGQMTISLTKDALEAMEDEDDEEEDEGPSSGGQMTIAINRDDLNEDLDTDSLTAGLPPPIQKPAGGQMTIAMTTDDLRRLDDEEEHSQIKRKRGFGALPPPIQKPVGGQMTIAMTTDDLKSLDDDDGPPTFNRAAQQTVNLNTRDLEADAASSPTGFKFSADDLLKGNIALPSKLGASSGSESASRQRAKNLIGDPVLAMATAEKYDVKKLLGQGQMGKVFLAYSKTLKRDIALKFTQPKGPNVDEILARFRREILVTTLVSHPNVVEVYDKEELPDGSYYMAMELLDGPDLKAYLREHGPFSIEAALDLIEQLAFALNACHEAEVVHRDVKPENVTILTQDGKLIAKLVDFGLSRLLTSEEVVQNQIFTSLATQISGSPRYMAPESITNADTVDYRCDIYALGITLYELLTGSPPFSGRNTNEILEQQLYSALPALSNKMPGKKVTPALDSFVRKMLAKERDQRHNNCVEVLNDIAAVRKAESEKSNPKTGFLRSISDLFRRG